MASYGPKPPATVYPAPPPDPYPHPAPSWTASARTSPNADFILLLIRAALVAAVIVVSIVAIYAYVILFPLPEFSVSSAAVSSFNLSVSPPHLSADFDLTISARNPNKKMGVYYDQVIVAVLYGHDILLTEASLPPFYHGKRNSTTLSARLATVAQYVEPDVASGIAGSRARGGDMDFQVRISARVLLQAWPWSITRGMIRVYCNHVTIGFANGTTAIGSMAGPPKRCHLGM